ncbi:phage tail tape measure protein [Bosea massiliensis]|uniref:Phage tail tape measure protein n=1 Tax=Bosea massiliensis TaxID=151419 RepID=A0ABW0NXG1_9HYPH
MAIVNEARAVLTAEDRASAVLAMVARNFDRLNRAADRLDANGAGARRQQVTQQAMSRTAVITERMGAVAARAAGPLAAVMGVYGAARFVNSANREFAQNERAMTRIAVTADASAEVQKASWSELQKLAFETAQPVDKVREGLESLVAAGRSLPEAMAFLPSVARTAQASGATTADIARSADAVGSAFKIAGADMQSAFDIMATGGKLGQFELKDMARYLPSLAPAAAAIGMEGKKGLTELVAMLQVLRKGSGTAEEAAGSMNNILQKMSSEETAKKYKKLGVDLEGMFKKGKATGQDMVSVFMEATQLATKGDLGKLPQLIGDMEFARGVRALMMFRGEFDKMKQTISATSAGAVAGDLNRVLSTSQATMDRMKISSDRLTTAVGERLTPAFQGLANVATAAMNAVSGALEPKKSDKELAAGIGAPEQLTPAEQSVRNAERVKKMLKDARDRGSELYSMRDGGFGVGTSRFSPNRAAILRNKSKLTKAERQELDGINRQEQKLREARDAADRRNERPDFTRFRADEAAFADSYKKEGRSGPLYGAMDAANRETQRRRDAESSIKIDDLLAGQGEAGTAFRAAYDAYVRSERARVLARRDAPSMDDGTPLPKTYDPTLGRQADEARTQMVRAAQELLARSGQMPTQAQIESLYGQLAEAAKNLSEKAAVVPGVDPQKVPGQAESMQKALESANITAKADISTTSDIRVKVEAEPGWFARLVSQVTKTTTTDTRGISLPGKETRSGGGGGMAP